MTEAGAGEQMLPQTCKLGIMLASQKKKKKKRSNYSLGSQGSHSSLEGERAPGKLLEVTLAEELAL